MDEPAPAADEPGTRREVPLGGRSLRWRLLVLVAGLLLLGAGGALVRWPWILAYAVGGAVALVGLLFVVSAVAARGRPRR